MHDMIPGLRMPAPPWSRDPGQRSAFGNFCLNVASFPLPPAIERRNVGGLEICFIRRKFHGLASPMINALVESPSSGEQADIWRTAEAVLPSLNDPEPPDIVKLFLAGVGRDRSPEIRRVGGGRGSYFGVFFPADSAEAIELTDGYETFLRTLGNHTRRDMRRLRRRAESSGMTFEFCRGLPPGSPERHDLGRATHPNPYLPKRIDAYDTFLAAQTDGFHALLRSRAGELLSCCAGFISDRSAVVLYQLNHRGYLKASLSLTNRSYTIEHLIKQGVREFFLPGGGGGLLVHAGRIRKSGELALIRRAAVPILKSVAVTLLSPYSSVALAVRHLAGSWPPGL